MKATIDIPDAMYRQVKAHAALQGRAIRDVTIELYRRWLEDQGAAAEGDAAGGRGSGNRAGDWLARWDAVGVEVATNAVEGRALSEIVIDERR